MTSDRANLERNVARLATERGTLFTRSSHASGLTPADQSRLSLIERELDENFAELRKLRAARDLSRFAREDPIVRRAMRATTPIGAKPAVR